MHDQPHLESVVGLHRANAKWLGFFPRGAFEEHAAAGHILLARSDDGEVLGYLLYRVAKHRATIVHLCTAATARGQGVARALVERLKVITKPLAGIALRCRQDYNARHVWAKFSFCAIDRKAGRSSDGHELTFWWFDHGHPDLFSLAAISDARRELVAIDANVFYDLQSEEHRDSEDSKALLADWVQASIELQVTKEIYNEIDRASTPDLRSRSKAAITGYRILPSDDVVFQRTCDELKTSFPEDAVLRDESDLRQVAYAVAGGAAYLVTRDSKLADRCESLYRRYGLQVLHPADLISKLDVIEREALYRPAQIEGSRLRSHAVTSETVEMVVDAFRDDAHRATDFRKTVLHFLGKPREIETRFVIDEDQRPVVLAAFDRTQKSVLVIPMLRSTGHPLATTMIRNYLRKALETATAEGRTVIRVLTGGCDETAIEGLAEFGFAAGDGAWTKVAIRTLGDFTTVRDAALTAASHGADASVVEATRVALTSTDKSRTPDAIAAAERLFWPAKILGAGLPTFVVSIRAEWAQHFFDNELAAQRLFAPREDLLLGIEGVYYCSAKHRHLCAPSRVLWYVSRGNEGEGSMSIKACSRIEEVVVGKPKELFKRFRRLGVYEWADVLKAADNDLSKNVLAFRFSMTERFDTPYSMRELEALDIRHPLLGPRRISDQQFASIYGRGFKFN